MFGLGRSRRKGIDPRFCEFLSPAEDAQAKLRAHRWAFDDPFPKVERSLLSAVAIRNYARVTAMVHPYTDSRLKAASYEVGLGGSYILWENGLRKDESVIENGCITLPANSISFVQTDVKFRLPHYMALRFNLQIAHVHRGILLGTGPLVDPGFEGILLIPLHNLTNSPYTIPLSEPLIWVEFTKTTFGQTEIEKSYDECCDDKFLFPDRKKNQTPDYYLTRANKGNPIASSIPDIIEQSALDAKRSADEAGDAKTQSTEAKRLAESADKKLFRIGVGGALAAIIALFAIYLQAMSTIQDSASAVHGADQIIHEAKQAADQRRQESRIIEELRSRVEALERRQAAPIPAAPPFGNLTAPILGGR